VSQPEPASEPTPDDATTTAAGRTQAAYPQAIHVRPTAPLAERVLLPGDPGRALALAQTLLEKPLMFNHNRGLWGYTGAAQADGEPLTIQATGIGGPSAAIVLTELIALGARRLIRVGTCGALAPNLALGDLVVARESVCADGTSRALTTDARVVADPALAEALVRAGRSQIGSARRPIHAGAIVSVDLFYEDSDSRSPHHPADALAIEMEAAALFAVGAATYVPVACVLAVSDTFDAAGARTRIDDDSLLAAGEAMGAVAVAALML
jgi:DeoD family purine-nucleoside phosphorylase